MSGVVQLGLESMQVQQSFAPSSPRKGPQVGAQVHSRNSAVLAGAESGLCPQSGAQHHTGHGLCLLPAGFMPGRLRMGAHCQELSGHTARRLHLSLPSPTHPEGGMAMGAHSREKESSQGKALGEARLRVTL